MKILSNKILRFSRYEELQEIEVAYNNDKKTLQDYEKLARLHLNIAKTIGSIDAWDNIDTPIEEITRQIFDVLNFEYVCIGRCLTKDLKDYKYITSKSVKIPEHLVSSPIEDSFIGQIILTYGNREIFVWSEQDGDITDIKNTKNKIPNIQPNHIERFKSYFSFTKVKQFMVIPLKHIAKEEVIGYIVMCNRNGQNGLERMEEESLKALSVYISRCIGRHLFYRYEHNDTQKIRKIHNLNYELGIKETLKYLYDEFSLMLAAFWIPVTDDNQPCFAMEDHYHEFKGRKEEAIEKEVGFRDGKICLKSDALKRRKKVNWFENLTKDKLGFSIDIGTNQAIVVLIHDDNESTKDDDLLGAFVLYPQKSLKKSHVVEERIKILADDIKHYLQATLFDRHYKQIELLREQLLGVDFNNSDNFYREIVGLVNNTLQSKYCSLFFANEKEELYLKATNAKKFTSFDKGTLENKKNFIAINYINKKDEIIYKKNSRSATYRAFINENTVNIYNIYSKNAKTETIFCEVSSYEHEPVIATPIKYQGKIRGVIRCINKENLNGRTIQAFDDLDIKMFEFLAQIVSKFIENIEKDKDQRNFVNHLAHENRTPVQIIWNDMHSIKRRIEQLAPTGNHRALNKTFKRLRLQTEIINNNYDNLEAVLTDKDLIAYRFNKTDLKEHIYDIVELLEPKLQEDEERPIRVETQIKNMPEVYVDGRKIYQVFYNVISNAARYSTYDSTIKIKYNDSVEVIIDNKLVKCLEITVSNYGIEISADEFDLIFKQYYRSPIARAKNATGKWIGLYVAQTIMMKHGGIIQVTQSTEPTTFSIFLPNKLKSKSPDTN